MATRTVNGKAVAADIQRGMSDLDLMTKYNLTPLGLSKLMAALKSAGLLQSGVKCPACGFPQPERFDECPQCGVLVSKISQKIELDRDKQTDESFQSWWTLYHRKVLTGVTIGVVCLVVLTCGLWMRSYRQAVAEQRRQETARVELAEAQRQAVEEAHHKEQQRRSELEAYRNQKKMEQEEARSIANLQSTSERLRQQQKREYDAERLRQGKALIKQAREEFDEKFKQVNEDWEKVKDVMERSKRRR